MERWQTKEAESSIRTLLQAKYPGVPTMIYYLSRVIGMYGLNSLETYTFGVMCMAIQVIIWKLTLYQPSLLTLRITLILYELVQLFLLSIVYFDSSESFTIHVINSTALLVVGEVSPIHSLAVNCVLIGKHVLLWVCIAWHKNVTGETISFIPTLWVFWNLLCILPYKRGLLIAEQLADEEKLAEERRMKAVLAAIPDGVVVMSEDLQVLTTNLAMLTQLNLHGQSNPINRLEKVITSLEFDTEYCEQEPRKSSFRDEICELVRGKEGIVKNFKPLMYEGKDLECRGCVTTWGEEEKVVVLTVRDTSNWANLEKTAKQDSAKKTALIRSVSHELRTPVNAILNLCQDLQSSPSLSPQDQLDVEVLSNASNFLLSIINDLLDYSRILHDKFELKKTSFDLEKLIRSCGALIALQCKQKEVMFIVRFDPSLPKLAYTDENRLKQVILNLLSNAVK